MQPNPYDSLLNPGGFGVFSDEGMTCGPFYTRESAAAALLREDPDGDSGLYVAGICHDHDDQEAGVCEECAADDDEDENQDTDEE